MAVSNEPSVTLEPEQLNDLDERILDYLAGEGRATPTLLQRELAASGDDPGVRQNVNARLVRLAEHGHLRNIRDSGVYEFVSDPRD